MDHQGTINQNKCIQPWITYYSLGRGNVLCSGLSLYFPYIIIHLLGYWDSFKYQGILIQYQQLILISYLKRFQHFLLNPIFLYYKHFSLSIFLQLMAYQS